MLKTLMRRTPVDESTAYYHGKDDIDVQRMNVSQFYQNGGYVMPTPRPEVPDLYSNARKLNVPLQQRGPTVSLGGMPRLRVFWEGAIRDEAPSRR